MAYVSPSTVTTGDLITAAKWNQDIVSNEQASAPDVFTTKGDLFVATAADTGARLAAGADGTVLVADSAQGAGVRWSDGIPQLIKRVGGSASNWNTEGATTYTPGSNVRMQVGLTKIELGSSDAVGSATLTIPTTYSGTPLLFVSTTYDAAYPVVVTSYGNTTTIYITVVRATTGEALDVYVSWMAIGPA